MASEGDELAVRGEERRAGVELAAVLAERPRGDDELVASVGNPHDASGHAPEHDVAAPLGSDGVGPRAVDRSPHELRAWLEQRERRGVERLAPRDRPDAHLEPVVADPAHVALVELVAPLTDVPFTRGPRLRERDRRRWVDLDGRRASLRDDRAPVDEKHAPVVPLDSEWTIERWGQPQGDLDLVGLDERGEASACVASVGRAQRPSIPARQDDLHDLETS